MKDKNVIGASKIISVYYWITFNISMYHYKEEKVLEVRGRKQNYSKIG